VSVYAIHAHVTDFAVYDELTVIGYHRGSCRDGAAQCVAQRLHIRQIDEIRLYFGAVLATRFIVGPNQV
jgi:hypothetical protein